VRIYRIYGVASKENYKLALIENRIVSVCILENMKKFSVDELKNFDGKGGRPAYVGYKGKVYDVTGSDQWLEGDHMGHVAGLDLTEDMDIAPHADDVMEKMKVVGVLAGF
jgi:predicted heme/steroid binding protein